MAPADVGAMVLKMSVSPGVKCRYIFMPMVMVMSVVELELIEPLSVMFMESMACNVRFLEVTRSVLGPQAVNRVVMNTLAGILFRIRGG